MSLEAGRKLLHYELLEKLGEGGMGVVWKALDTTLDREVAIKVLPAALAADPDRLARFEREAKLVASLTHPNIASVFSVHEVEGRRFLAMELVPGEDLERRIARGPIEPREAMEIGVQIAEALEEAHEQGIVHRDLKPANVLRTPDGEVKVLDFGLARAFGPPEPEGGDPSLSPTLTSAGTLAGVILGTAAYMAPEQARGYVVDHRADVWAFGAMLYQMLTGNRPFEGETISDTLASVLKLEPDWEALPAETPTGLRRLLHRCLQKDRRERLHHIADARLELRDCLDGTAIESAAGAPPAEEQPAGKSSALPWLLVVAPLALITIFSLWQALKAPKVVPRDPIALSIPIPPDKRLLDTQEASMSIAPDGRTLAILLSGSDGIRLYLRRLDDDTLIEVPNSRGASTPFFSPDSEWVGFFADGALLKASVAGGAPVRLTAAGEVNRGATWTDQDTIVLTASFNDGLQAVSASGGALKPLTELDPERQERTHRWPNAIPGTDVVLFTVGDASSPEFYDDSRIDAVRLSSGERKTVYEGASYALYAPTGHLLIGRGGFLFAVPFDVEALEVRGEPVPVQEQVLSAPRSGLVNASVSQNGLLAYAPGGTWASRRVLAWADLDGTKTQLPIRPGTYQFPDLSPDGKRLAISVAGDRDFDIWTYEFASERWTRLTFDEGNIGPFWSPDGASISYYSVIPGGGGGSHRRPADGSGPSEVILEQDGIIVSVTDWAPGDRYVLELVASDADISILDAAVSGDPRKIVYSDADERNGVLSPDGRFLTYQSDESGRDEIYVQRVDGRTGRWQVSSGGGVEPHWPDRGGRLFYRHGRQLYYAEVETEPTFSAGQPVPFVEMAVGFSREVSGFSAHPDGDRVLLIDEADREGRSDEIRVVIDWFEILKALPK